jgi:hypothetical protein
MNASSMAVRIKFIRNLRSWHQFHQQDLSSRFNFYNLVTEKRISISRHKALRPMQNADNDNSGETPVKISPAAERALKEAEERRKSAQALELPPEIGGRDGPEPVRFGDYEIKGRAIDF